MLPLCFTDPHPLILIKLHTEQLSGVRPKSTRRVVTSEAPTSGATATRAAVTTTPTTSTRLSRKSAKDGGKHERDLFPGRDGTGRDGTGRETGTEKSWRKKRGTGMRKSGLTVSATGQEQL